MILNNEHRLGQKSILIHRNIQSDTARELVAHEPVRPAVMDHLEQSIAENEAVGRLLAGLSTLEPLDASFPDVDEDLPSPDDVTF